MATLHCLSSCFTLPKKSPILTISASYSRLPLYSTTTFSSINFSRHLSETSISKSYLGFKVVERSARRSIVCEATPNKKPDSAAKRARQSEKRRIYNKGKKSEMRTRMKKVLETLDSLRKKKDAQSEEIISIEKLIAEAYSAIDKAVKAGAVHKNTGANRKSRLARRKKAIEIHHGWYTPAAAAAAAESA